MCTDKGKPVTPKKNSIYWRLNAIICLRPKASVPQQKYFLPSAHSAHSLRNQWNFWQRQNCGAQQNWGKSTSKRRSFEPRKFFHVRYIAKGGFAECQQRMTRARQEVYAMFVEPATRNQHEHSDKPPNINEKTSAKSNEETPCARSRLWRLGSAKIPGGFRCIWLFALWNPPSFLCSPVSGLLLLGCLGGGKSLCAKASHIAQIGEYFIERLVKHRQIK